MRMGGPFVERLTSRGRFSDPHASPAGAGCEPSGQRIDPMEPPTTSDCVDLWTT